MICARAILGGVMVLAAGCSGDLVFTSPSGGGGGGGGSDGGGISGRVTFRPNVQDELERTGCTAAPDCHGLSTVPMFVMSDPSTDADWERNYEEVREVSASSTTALLLIKPVGASGHPTVLSANSSAIMLWREWIEQGNPYE